MLNVMRKHASSWIIKILLIAIVIVFVFWGVGNFSARQASRVASVNGTTITLSDYQEALNALIEQYRQQLGTPLDDNMITLLRVKEQALDQLINHILTLQEAQKLGLMVTDAEVADFIRNAPFFQTNGVFDSQLYYAFLSQRRQAPEVFESEQRNLLLIRKLERLMSGAAKVSETEVRDWYNWENTMVNIEYVLFSRESNANPGITPEAVADYFEANKERYTTPAMRKILYVKVDPAAYRSGVTIDEDAVIDYYESHPELFNTEKQVEARHILIAVDADTTEAEAQQKATDISTRAKTGENFAELATLFSDCPSKAQGGHLGFFTRGQLVKSFSDTAFSMVPGEISAPVKTEFGWHVIKVESVKEATSQSLDQSREQIVGTLTTLEAQHLAHEAAEQLYENIYESDDLKEQAAAAGLNARDAAVTMAEGLAELGEDSHSVASIAFELDSGETSDVREVNGCYYLIQVTEALSPTIPPLDTVRDTVTADLKKKIQADRARAMADAMAADLLAEKPFSDSARAQGATLKKTGLFKRDAAIPGIGKDVAFTRAAFEIQPDAPIRMTPVEGDAGFYLLRLTERQLPTADVIDEADRTRIATQLIQQKKRSVFQEWMNARRGESDIVIEKGFSG
ncbi:SurA N-terminal domain-containing protein [Desulfosarcina sp. OttesenSCG-928-A07]|nr:SurA N-terminal domain-containing protein [Desulfosarcina sp. OttesenSCG-928-G17]MDL2328701.1 SurA N-terminal domain-containing protein [Desulfosarcina sp. OttesenSCG-928-A07]